MIKEALKSSGFQGFIFCLKIKELLLCLFQQIHKLRKESLSYPRPERV
jgi:hypothetical protein